MKFTEAGKTKVNVYITELKAKRKEILDAGLDTADETTLPDEKDILDDIEFFEEENEYYNNWGVTDNYNGDNALYLKRGEDYI